MIDRYAVKVGGEPGPVSPPSKAEPAGADFRVVVPKGNWPQYFFELIDERAKASELRDLKKSALPNDDLEVRIWGGFGLTRLRGFVLRRASGKWSAFDLTWETAGNEKIELHRVDSPVGVNDGDWDKAWNHLLELGILTLPDAEEIGCTTGVEDGYSYVVEYNVNNEYRAYMYDNPDLARCQEARQLQKMVEFIDQKFLR